MFLIETPSVADTLDVSDNVKLPFWFVIAILPSDVFISDAIFDIVPFVVILILPFVFVISPIIVFEPFVLEIVVLPSPFVILPDWLYPFVVVNVIAPFVVAISLTDNPFDVIVILPVPSVILFEIALVIILFPFDEITILPFSFVIAFVIDKFDVELFAIFTLPALLIAPDIVTASVPFCVIIKSPLLFIFFVIFNILPEFVIDVLPRTFVIAPVISKLFALLLIVVLPFWFVIWFDIVKPPNDEIITSLLVFTTVPAIDIFWAFVVFLIETPSVADTSDNLKLPFLFSISTVPSKVLTVDLISELVPLVVILILPLVFSTFPLITFEPFVLEIVVLPSPFVILPDWLYPFVVVNVIAPFVVAISLTDNPFDVIVILPVPSVILFEIALVIILFPFDEITILPFSFVIAFVIDRFDVDWLSILIFPTLSIKPAILTIPLPFWVIAKLPILSISPVMSILPPPFAKKTSPLRFVILLEDVISPFVLYIDKSPFLLIM